MYRHQPLRHPVRNAQRAVDRHRLRILRPQDPVQRVRDPLQRQVEAAADRPLHLHIARVKYRGSRVGCAIRRSTAASRASRSRSSLPCAPARRQHLERHRHLALHVDAAVDRRHSPGPDLLHRRGTGRSASPMSRRPPPPAPPVARSSRLPARTVPCSGRKAATAGPSAASSKSLRSSTQSTASPTATTSADRGASVSRLISPKQSPASSLRKVTPPGPTPRRTSSAPAWTM